MPTDWSDDIIIADLADEPQLSEEMSALFGRLGGESSGSADSMHIILNFGDVTYVNSSNLAQLLRLRKRLEGSGRMLVLCAVNADVQSVLNVTGLERFFRFAPDPMTALATIQVEHSS